MTRSSGESAADPLKSREVTTRDGRFLVAPAHVQDCATIARIQAVAYAGHAFLEDVYPGFYTVEGHKKWTAILQAQVTKPNSYLNKIVETRTGKIVGSVRWDRLTRLIPTLKLPVAGTGDWQWSSEEEKERAELEFNELLDYRRETFRKQEGKPPAWSLGYTFLHPEYQRCGAGEAAMRWGLEIADQEGVPTILEAIIGARTYYARYDFVEERHVDLHDPAIGWPEEWKTDGPIDIYFQRREPQTPQIKASE